MMLKKIIGLFIMACIPLLIQAEKHTQFIGLPLTMPADSLAAELASRGLHRDDRLALSGLLSGVPVWVTLESNPDTVGCNYLRVTTQEQGAQMQGHHYQTLMSWMKKQYGRPDWEATVRSQRFARWYVSFDHDIIMIASGSKAVDLWFFENHETRNLDYYAILKYCERHPANGVPHLAARDCAVWKSKSPLVEPKAKKIGKKRGRHARRATSHKSRRKRHSRR